MALNKEQSSILGSHKLKKVLNGCFEMLEDNSLQDIPPKKKKKVSQDN